MTARREQHQSELASLRDDNHRLIEEVERLTDTLKRTNAELAEREGQLDVLHTDLDEARAEAGALRDHLTELETERMGLVEQRDEARRERESLEVQERQLAADADEETRSALRVERLKAEKRVQEAEVRLHAMESQVVELEDALKVADSRATEAAADLSATSDQLVGSRETVARQSLSIGLLSVAGVFWLIWVARRGERKREGIISRAWRMFRPLLTDGDHALGPVEMAALKEMVVAGEAVHRQRTMVAAGMRMLLVTGALGLLFAVVDSTLQGFWDKPVILGDIITSNLLTFLVGAGGPLGLLVALTKQATERLSRSIETAQKLGIPSRLTLAASGRDDFKQQIARHWYWPETAPNDQPFEALTDEVVAPVDVQPIA
jgi:hypothetical protein